MIQNKSLKRRIVEISYRLKLGHIGSCLTAVDIIEEIYRIKKPDEKFVLSAGHAHLAHAVVMEKYTKEKIAKRIDDGMPYPPSIPIEFAIKEYGIHCDRTAGCDASTGSLGHGIGIAVGMALADRSRDVYCLVSDGELAEGSVYEASRIAKEQGLGNLRVYLNYNGWGAYRRVNFQRIDFPHILIRFTDETMNDYPKYLQGQLAHYKVLKEEEYKEVMEILK